jgi:hypothetical protein
MLTDCRDIVKLLLMYDWQDARILRKKRAFATVRFDTLPLP